VYDTDDVILLNAFFPLIAVHLERSPKSTVRVRDIEKTFT
jgi:hypothetical protein